MKKIQIKDKTFETYLTEGQIKQRIKELGVQIGDDFKGEELVLLGVLNGSFVVMADLVRAIPIPLTCEFIKISSYSGMESTGKVMEVIGIPPSIARRQASIFGNIPDSSLGNNAANSAAVILVIKESRSGQFA